MPPEDVLPEDELPEDEEPLDDDAEDLVALTVELPLLQRSWPVPPVGVEFAPRE